VSFTVTPVKPATGAYSEISYSEISYSEISYSEISYMMLYWVKCITKFIITMQYSRRCL